MALLPDFLAIEIFFLLIIFGLLWLSLKFNAPYLFIIGAIFVILFGAATLKNDFKTDSGLNVTIIGSVNTTSNSTLTQQNLTTPLDLGISHQTLGVTLILVGIFFLLIGVLKQLGKV